MTKLHLFNSLQHVTTLSENGNDQSYISFLSLMVNTFSTTLQHVLRRWMKMKETISIFPLSIAHFNTFLTPSIVSRRWMNRKIPNIYSPITNPSLLLPPPCHDAIWKGKRPNLSLSPLVNIFTPLQHVSRRLRARTEGGRAVEWARRPLSAAYVQAWRHGAERAPELPAAPPLRPPRLRGEAASGRVLLCAVLPVSVRCIQ